MKFSENLKKCGSTGNGNAVATGCGIQRVDAETDFLAECGLKTKKLHAILNMERGLAWRFLGGIGKLKT
jgi:hypothetical protein